MSTNILDGARVMVKYTERLLELTQFAQETYGVDEQSMRILCACLLGTGDQPPVWMRIDATRHPFIQHLLQFCSARGIGWNNLPSLILDRPRKQNLEVEAALSERNSPRLLTDWAYKSPQPNLHPRGKYSMLVQEALGIEIKLAYHKIPYMGAAFEFTRLLKLVLDWEHRPFSPIPMTKAPELLLLAAGLASRVTPFHSNITGTMRNAAMLPASLVVLEGRVKVTEQDYTDTLRVIGESIPWRVRRVLRVFGERDGSVDVPLLEIETLMSRAEVTGICEHLADSEVLSWPKIKKPKGTGRAKYMSLSSETGPDLLSLIDGTMRIPVRD